MLALLSTRLHYIGLVDGTWVDLLLLYLRNELARKHVLMVMMMVILHSPQPLRRSQLVATRVLKRATAHKPASGSLMTQAVLQCIAIVLQPQHSTPCPRNEHRSSYASHLHALRVSMDSQHFHARGKQLWTHNTIHNTSTGSSSLNHTSMLVGIQGLDCQAVLSLRFI